MTKNSQSTIFNAKGTTRYRGSSRHKLKGTLGDLSMFYFLDISLFII